MIPVQRRTKAGQRWAELHASGLTAPEAARLMGRTAVAAYEWAKRRGKAWPNAAVVPVTVRGVAYPSITAAARALGVDPGFITRALRDHGCADHVGLGVQIGRLGTQNRARPCVIAGVAFARRQDLARYIGLSPSNLVAFERAHGPAAVADRVMARRMAEGAAASRAAMADAEMLDRPSSKRKAA